MSLYDRWAAPEPECSDDEWESARARIIAERVDDGWDLADAEAAAEDDQLVWEQVDADRADAESRWADDVLARRKEDRS